MKNIKIFIIEDDVNVFYGLEAKFRIDGYQVAGDNGAENIENTINKIRIYRPNYIVLDLVLPKTDGFSLLERIKSDPHLNKPCVFIFSNMIDNDSKERCDRLGADYFFAKGDMVLDGIVEKIEKTIENRIKIGKDKQT